MFLCFLLICLIQSLQGAYVIGLAFVSAILPRETVKAYYGDGAEVGPRPLCGISGKWMLLEI